MVVAACQAQGGASIDEEVEAAEHTDAIEAPERLAAWLDEAQQAERAGVPAELVVDTPLDTDGRGQPGLVAGEPVDLEQEVPLNLVFIGYEPDDVDVTTVLATLPETYVPRSRFPYFYGGGRPLDVSFSFDYEAYFADESFEDALFTHLQQIGEEGQATVFQQAYNAQQNNVLDVSEQVLYIDGAEAESWLADHRGQLMPSERSPGYTVYFVNWYGREDFRFHVYGRPGAADPDTGFAFGDQENRQVIGWGGTHHRGWFLDLSAGPEAWSTNWVVDVLDIDGDGVEDYRMPPSWEYDEAGYRDPAALSQDLGWVTRFVAINQLFTPSPIYDPMVTAPGLGGRKLVHMELFEDDEDPALDGVDLLDAEHVTEQMARFQPYHGWRSVLESNDPIDTPARDALRIFTGAQEGEGCWTEYGDPSVQLSCYFLENVADYVPEYRPDDYVAEVFAFNTTDEGMGSSLGLLGFADDNLLDGTQTHVYEFASPATISAGYGLTDTTVHELGHHFGLSHPHDGYDSEYDFNYGPGGGLYFAWLGSHSDSVMHYLGISEGFGVFNQDTLYRLETAGYLGYATRSLELVESWEADNGAPWWTGLLKSEANRWARRARRAFGEWRFLQSAAAAKVSYSLMQLAQEALGIETPEVAPRFQPVPQERMACGIRNPTP